MKKHTIAIVISAFASLAYAQSQNVGINTDQPTNQLHIKSGSDPLRLEGLERIDNLEKGFFLVVDENGVVKKAPTSQAIASTSQTVNEAQDNKWDLSQRDPDVGYVVDGNSSWTITLPKAKPGSRIFFFPWGGAGYGGPNGTVTYKFIGSANGPLSAPSSSVTSYPTDISWDRSNGNKLILTERTNRVRFRYTLLEFIVIAGSWWYVHR